MSCFKEHVKYYLSRVIILFLTLQLNVRKSLHYIAISGKRIYEPQSILFYMYIYIYVYQMPIYNIIIYIGIWNNFCMGRRQ